MQVESRTDALMVPLAEFGRGDIARVGGKNASLGRHAVAVRSAATAEDLPEASFAGQLETFLNVRGERSEAVKQTIAQLLAKAGNSGTKTGLCGQAPSTHPEFAEFLVAHGIDSISVTPDSFIAVKQAVARAESA